MGSPPGVADLVGSPALVTAVYGSERRNIEFVEISKKNLNKEEEEKGQQTETQTFLPLAKGWR